jgi:stage V sporulation protein B
VSRGDDAPAPDPARAAGRGGLGIAGAKLYFILTGLVQQVALKHIVGLGAYGDLGDVQSLASVAYNPVVAGSIQGVSRAVSSSPAAEQAAAHRRAVLVHWAAVAPVGAVLFFAAPALARSKLVPHLAVPLQLAAGVLVAYGMYAPLVGALNGRRRFGWQAALDVVAATIRTAGLLAGAWLFVSAGLGVEGALGGFVVAATLMIAAALAAAGLGERGPGGPPAGRYLAFVAPVVGGQLLINLLMQADLQLLGRFAGEAALAGALAPDAAGPIKGAYRAAQLFCFLPYQLLLSVAFVLFPLLATAQRDADRAAIARYVREGVRVALVVAGCIVSVTAALPAPLLRLVFGADAAALGADAMGVMAIGLGAFALFGVLTTVLNSLGRERLSAALTAGALALVVALSFALVRDQPLGAALLTRAAAATSVGLVTATLLAALFVRRAAGAAIAPAALARVAAGIAAAILVGRAVAPALAPYGAPVAALGGAQLVLLVYLGCLVATGELTRADLALARRVLGPRAS